MRFIRYLLSKNGGWFVMASNQQTSLIMRGQQRHKPDFVYILKYQMNKIKSFYPSISETFTMSDEEVYGKINLNGGHKKSVILVYKPIKS